MNRLFAEVYLDEDVSVLVADLLRARGFRAETTRDSRNLGYSDVEQLEYAANHEMVLLTHNRADFEALHQQYLERGDIHWGIIVASRRRPYAIMERVARLLDRMTAEEFKSQLLYV